MPRAPRSHDPILSAQVPIAVVERLRTSARKHGRSLSSEVRRALAVWIAAQDAAAE